MIKWIFLILGIVLITSCSQEGISINDWDERNRKHNKAIEEEAALFRQLLFAHRFDEIEETVEQMSIDLIDVFDRLRIGSAICSMYKGDYMSKAYPHILAWCDQSPDSYLAFTVKGYLFTNLAWRYRGGGYANSVSEEGWEKFRSNLIIAEESLTRAYELNPQSSLAATEMITVSMGRSYPRSEMEKWFQRAISVPNIENRSYGAKLLYLQPKWGGSLDDLLSFVYETDRLGVPLFTIATTYGGAWIDMPSRKLDLLPNKTFLEKAANAYQRSLVEYPYRTVQRVLCAFFAVKSGNYALAAEQFQYFSWEDVDKYLYLWATQAEYEADKAMSIKKSNQKLEPTS